MQEGLHRYVEVEDGKNDITVRMVPWADAHQRAAVGPKQSVSGNKQMPPSTGQQRLLSWKLERDA